MAIGTSDGFVALRNLANKSTQLRYIMSGKLPSQIIGDLPDLPSSKDGSILQLVTGIKGLHFLPGPSVCTKLIALTGESCFIWHPKEMILLSSVRFSQSLHRMVIDVAWATHSGLRPHDEPPVAAFLVADGSIRLAATAKPDALKNIDELALARAANPNSPNSERPVSELVLSSAITEDILSEISDSLAIGSLMPIKALILTKHLMQNQAWCEINYQLDKCPDLDQGFSRLKRATDCFLSILTTKNKPLFAELCSSNILERCYLTAVAMGNTFEIKLWRLLGYRLLHLTGKSGEFLSAQLTRIARFR
ncbi:WD repeat-containing protein 11 [Cichlidogyrus casuarinus]|uniref:WD repeat-containing protein 11 n=1 Tax=Cichlidogyrus casuarinus TaxID=1844966 RepID=A0ABD2QCC4_9PLAT